MTHADILTQVRRIFAERLDVRDAIDAQTDLLADLQLDSLKQLSLIVELENHFRICFDPGDETGISTVGSVVELIHLRLQQRADT